MPIDELTAEPTELLRTTIRNAGVSSTATTSGSTWTAFGYRPRCGKHSPASSSVEPGQRAAMTTTPTLRNQRRFGGVDLRPGLDTVRADDH
jgi:hypothetical protein